MIRDKKYYSNNNDVNGNYRKLTHTNLFIIISNIITGIISKINKLEIFRMNEVKEVFLLFIIII